MTILFVYLIKFIFKRTSVMNKSSTYDKINNRSFFFFRVPLNKLAQPAKFKRFARASDPINVPLMTYANVIICCYLIPRS